MGEFIYCDEGSGSRTDIKAARKPHDCTVCGAVIPVGSPYRRYEYFGADIYPGKVIVEKFCSPCSVAQDECIDQYGSGPEILTANETRIFIDDSWPPLDTRVDDAIKREKEERAGIC